MVYRSFIQVGQHRLLPAKSLLGLSKLLVVLPNMLLSASILIVASAQHVAERQQAHRLPRLRASGASASSSPPLSNTLLSLSIRIVNPTGELLEPQQAHRRAHPRRC